MRLIQIQLKASEPFWFLKDIIKLNQNNRISDFINADSLTESTKKIINLSIKRKEVDVIDYEGNPIKDLNEIIYVYGDMAVSVEDVKEPEENLTPEMVSVTVSMDDEEKEEEKKLSIEPGEEDIESAKILLGQNGNTIKKMIRNMKQTNENLTILHASMDIEISGKNRKGILVALQDAIAGY